MSLSFPDRAVIRLPAVMMNGQGEFISGEMCNNNPCAKHRATCGRHLRNFPATTPHCWHRGDRGCPGRGSNETMGRGSGAASKMAPAWKRRLTHTTLCPLWPLQPRGAWQLCQELWWPLINLHGRSRQAPWPCSPAFPRAMPPMSVPPGPAGWGPQRSTAGTQPGFPS